MRYVKTFSACLITAALSGAAWAEVYETTDAEGNPEFTNSPTAADAKVVDIPPTNVIDAPQAEPQAQAQELQAETEPEQQQPAQENNTVIIDNPNTNEVYDEALAKQRAFERMDPAAPHEVGDSNSQMPREVGDFPSETPEAVDDLPDENEEIYNPAEHRGIHQGHRRE
jgi:hypothetical protein